MSVHDQVYLQMLSAVIFGNRETLQTEAGLIDSGEQLPEGAFEPWMRTEVKSHITEVNGVRSVSILFTAGPAEAPFQQFVMTASLDGDPVLSVLHTMPGDEYHLCEIVNYIAHFVITQKAMQEGVRGCCCPHNPEVHDCSEETVQSLAQANEFKTHEFTTVHDSKNYLAQKEEAKVLPFRRPE